MESARTYWYQFFNPSNTKDGYVILYGYYGDYIAIGKIESVDYAKRIVEILNQELKADKPKRRYSLRQSGEFFLIIDNQNEKGKFQYDGPIIGRCYVYDYAQWICDLLNFQEGKKVSIQFECDFSNVRDGIRSMKEEILESTNKILSEEYESLRNINDKISVENALLKERNESLTTSSDSYIERIIQLEQSFLQTNNASLLIRLDELREENQKLRATNETLSSKLKKVYDVMYD